MSRANSDIYTLALELEGVEDGVIDELLRIAQAGKGEAALEHARIMRDLEPALIAAGYEGVDDYRYLTTLKAAADKARAAGRSAYPSSPSSAPRRPPRHGA